MLFPLRVRGLLGDLLLGVTVRPPAGVFGAIHGGRFLGRLVELPRGVVVAVELGDVVETTNDLRNACDSGGGVPLRSDRVTAPLSPSALEDDGRLPNPDADATGLFSPPPLLTTSLSISSTPPCR